MKITILISTFFLIINSIFTQTTELEKKELYPDKYTFEKAILLQEKGEYEKAIWFYINLFPENKSEVIKIVKSLEVKLDSVDMSSLIKKSFAIYGTFDPSITSFVNGSPNMDMEKLKIKGNWGDELIQKISNPNKPLSSATEYNHRALQKANKGKFEEAIKDFDKAIEIKPTGQLYYNRAYSKSMIKDFQGAVEDYDNTIELKYRLAEAYFESGYCYDQLGKTIEAIKKYSNAIKQNKEYADAYNNRAVTKLKQKDYKKAIEDFDKAIKINPKYAEAFVNRGFANKAQGNKLEACKDWEKAIELGFNQAQQFINDNCK